MYDFLEGKPAERRASRLVVEVGGVGYDISVPLGADFPAKDGTVRAWTHLVVREDAHLLFGFPDRKLREVFRLLLSVRGVGPAAGLALLSRLSGEELLAAVAAQDATPLLKVKGIGQKTAQQILLDLRDKAPRLMAAPEEETVLVPRASPRSVEDAVTALVSIGFSDKEARRNVERAVSKVGTEDLEGLLRSALRE